jgi:hypothetical protein
MRLHWAGEQPELRRKFFLSLYSDYLFRPLKYQSNALRPGYLPGIVITGYIEITDIVITREYCIIIVSSSINSTH